jgi:hypothetical protein
LWKALVDASSGHTMTSLAPWDMMKLACGCTHASEQRYTTIALTLAAKARPWWSRPPPPPYPIHHTLATTNLDHACLNSHAAFK